MRTVWQTLGILSLSSFLYELLLLPLPHTVLREETLRITFPSANRSLDYFVIVEKRKEPREYSKFLITVLSISLHNYLHNYLV